MGARRPVLHFSRAQGRRRRCTSCTATRRMPKRGAVRSSSYTAVSSSTNRRYGRRTSGLSSSGKLGTSPRATASNSQARRSRQTSPRTRTATSKKAVIALAEELEVTFSAYVILYAIGRTQHKVDLVALGELVLPHTGATGTAFRVGAVASRTDEQHCRVKSQHSTRHALKNQRGKP
jgi:hypothetical protein